MKNEYDKDVFFSILENHILNPSNFEESNDSKSDYSEKSYIDLDVEQAVTNSHDELKSIYRKLVLRIHPDKSQDEIDKKIREVLMKEANNAYENNDLDKLLKMLDKYQDIS